MWSIYQGSITGPYHERKGEESQDYYVSEIVDTPHGEVAIIIAADGAGSHARSLEGATITCEELLPRCTQLAHEGDFSQESLALALDKVRSLILEEEGYREMGCTVAVAICGPGGWSAGVLGDAFAVLHHGDGSHEFLQGESISEFANVTELITSKEVHPVFANGDEPLRGISVSSDGLESMSIQRGEPLPGFWDTLLSHMAGESFSMDDFLLFLKGKGMLEDDTTLVTALRDEEVEESA